MISGSYTTSYEKTYVSIAVFDKGISTGLSFAGTSLVKEKVELGHFAELGKYFEECISVTE